MSKNMLSRFINWITFSTDEYSEISHLRQEFSHLREEFRKFKYSSNIYDPTNTESSEESEKTSEDVKPNYDDHDYDENLNMLRLIIRRFIFRYHDERVRWVNVKYAILEKKYFVYIRLTPIPCYPRSSTEVHHNTFYIRLTIERQENPNRALELTFDHTARNGIDGGLFTYGMYVESKYRFAFNSNEFYKYIHKVLHDKHDLDQMLYDLNKFII